MHGLNDFMGVAVIVAVALVVVGRDFSSPEHSDGDLSSSFIICIPAKATLPIVPAV
jgi:hypothetical protein